MPTIELYDYELPVPISDLEQLQRILVNNDVFCSGPTAGNIYNWRTCRKAHADGVEVLALFDRNVLNDVVSLALTVTTEPGAPLSSRARFGAAVMGYLLCCNITIDPGLAVHEWPADAVHKLTLFRRADEVDATVYVDIALERADRILPDQLPPPKVRPGSESIRREVSGLEEHRLAVLKIAELERSALPPRQKLEQFFDWTFNHYIFLPSAITLAAQQFAPSRTKPLLRRVWSEDRQRALLAVDNATWDLVVASHWAERVTKQLPAKKFWVLSSRDEALKTLAKRLHFSQDAGESQESAVRRVFVDLWGTSNGTLLSERLLALMGDNKNPARWCNQAHFDERISGMTREFEARFLSWKPWAKSFT